MEPMTADERLLQAKFDRVYQLAREAEQQLDAWEYPSEGPFRDFVNRILEALTEVAEEVPS